MAREYLLDPRRNLGDSLFLRRAMIQLMVKQRLNWQLRNHTYKRWFWTLNYPVCALLYITAPVKVMGLYIALCSIYANVETSHGAQEAKDAQSTDYYER